MKSAMYVAPIGACVCSHIFEGRRKLTFVWGLLCRAGPRELRVHAALSLTG